jgi:hypothetical protein
MRRFEQEARTVAALSHPDILALYDIGTRNSTPYLVSELLEGRTLREQVESGWLPVRQAVDTAVQIARGLAAAHDKGSIHRDLKPANVFLTKAGYVKILDFGLAKLARPEAECASNAPTTASSTETGAVVGTVGYMAPEQVRGLPCDPRADIFGFGCVLYEMLSGQRAFKGATTADTISAILKEDPPPLTDLREAVSSGLRQIVDRCLEKRPEDRFSSAHDLALALEAVSIEPEGAPRGSVAPSTGGTTDETGVLNPKRLGLSLRKLRVVIPAAAVILAIASLGTWYLNYRAKVRWAREEALPQIEKLLDENNVWRDLIPVYRLAEKAEAIIPSDAKLAELFTKCSLKINIKTDPPGARIFMKDYQAPDSEWTYLGVSPIEKVRLPIGIFKACLQEPKRRS